MHSMKSLRASLQINLSRPSMLIRLLSSRRIWIGSTRSASLDIMRRAFTKTIHRPILKPSSRGVEHGTTNTIKTRSQACLTQKRRTEIGVTSRPTSATGSSSPATQRPHRTMAARDQATTGTIRGRAGAGWTACLSDTTTKMMEMLNTTWRIWMTPGPIATSVLPSKQLQRTRLAKLRPR